MDIHSVHLNSTWLWAHFIYWPILLYAFYKAPWSILKNNNDSYIYFAVTTVVFMIWQLKVEVDNGLYLHLLGATLLTLMFRWQMAVIANFMILVGVTLITEANIEAFAFNALITGIIPIFISYTIWRLNEWYLPPNYFVYIFVAAFLSAGLAIFISGVLSHSIISALTDTLSEEILNEFFWIFIPIMYPEAFITGGAISIFVVYKPEWIATFSDQRYFAGK